MRTSRCLGRCVVNLKHAHHGHMALGFCSLRVRSIEAGCAVVIRLVLEHWRFPDSARHVILCFSDRVFDANCPVWMGVAVAGCCQGIYIYTCIFPGYIPLNVFGLPCQISTEEREQMSNSASAASQKDRTILTMSTVHGIQLVWS